MNVRGQLSSRVVAVATTGVLALMPICVASPVLAQGIRAPSERVPQAGTPRDLLLPADPQSGEPQSADVQSADVQRHNASGAMQGSAVTRQPMPPSTAMQAMPVVQDIATDFFETAPQWDEAAAKALLAFIRTVDAEGLFPRDYQPIMLEAAIASGDRAALNDTATRLFTWVAQDLRDGRTEMPARRQWFVRDPDAERLPIKPLLEEALASGDIAGALNSLNPVHPDYRALRDMLAKTPKAQKEKRAKILANMDRWRWLGQDMGRSYLLTNVPEYQLRLTVNDKIVRSYKTVVGKPGRTATPQLVENVQGVIFNPTWTVPQSIVVGEGLGAKLLGNPRNAAAQGYKAWKTESGMTMVVQQPGANNSLGLMKLDMPNEHAIFLHDTPAKHFFGQDDRALSHGCIRTERALELAMTLAMAVGGLEKDDAVAISTSGEYTRVPLQKELPVYITYFTMARDIDGEMRSFNDIYGRDEPVLASLSAPRVAKTGQRVTEEAVIPIEAPGA
ncbi:L,D-transpeptidase family protein [Croceicoccus sp. F390]|uniref:L,D-transpeptidase family protein n=1 Tax=Croceicoccus esteveae TaxID=3075597 RepID=A0ABU2ZLC5_9SPHN|nr:L,D-transpeptidase family protein [Croceicoccus sp. F390]MDT0577026.1 L,D-transpeptidase family protein [Croceicoccus sp. F390]